MLCIVYYVVHDVCNVLYAVYCILYDVFSLLCVLGYVAVLFMEHWKRRQMRLNYTWDLTGFGEEEEVR